MQDYWNLPDEYLPLMHQLLHIIMNPTLWASNLYTKQNLVKARNNDFSKIKKMWASCWENILRLGIIIEVKLNMYVCMYVCMYVLNRINLHMYALLSVMIINLNYLIYWSKKEALNVKYFWIDYYGFMDKFIAYPLHKAKSFHDWFIS